MRGWLLDQQVFEWVLRHSDAHHPGKRGETVLSNLRTLCNICNCRKGARLEIANAN